MNTLTTWHFWIDLVVYVWAIIAFVLIVGIYFYDKARIEAEDAWAIINELRAEDGASVLILCDNEDADTSDEQTAIEVNALWTDWNDRRFYGRTVFEALKAALKAKGETAHKIGGL